jgi:hypothetical protein
MPNTPTLAAPTRGSDARSRSSAREILADQTSHWSPAGSLDSGDSHDKGEPSLCVGEAA